MTDMLKLTCRETSKKSFTVLKGFANAKGSFGTFFLKISLNQKDTELV